MPPEYSVVFAEREIEQALDRTAVALNIAFRDKTPIFVAVMNGGLPTTWDLMRRVSLDISLDFVRVHRYQGTNAGSLRLDRDVEHDVSGKDVVLIDDILDRGVTMNYLVSRFISFGANVTSVVLIDKPNAREVPIEADYVCLEAENDFLVGRGMDCDGRFRQLSQIYKLNA